MRLFPILTEIGWFDLLDIVVMTFLIYTVLVWFKKTRAASVLLGILIIAGFYLVARQFNLVLTASVFQGFFAVILVAVVVIFQEELRHFFERVAVLGLRGRFVRKRLEGMPQSEVAILVRTLTDLAKERIGALVVLKGKDMILRHLEGGEPLNGIISESLLKSLFDPHTPGHDGAVIVEGNLISQFSCHLPLSKNFKEIGKRGTRHAAALGLSELADALCLVASEEKGTISVVRHGELKEVSDAEALSSILEKFYRERNPHPEQKSWQRRLSRNWKEKGIAFGLAGLLWFLHVYGSKIVYRNYPVVVETPELPSPLRITGVDSKEVEVTFSGPRRAFYFLSKGKMRLLLKIWQPQEGLRTIRVSASDLMVPKNLTIENIVPKRINVQIEGAPEN